MSISASDVAKLRAMTNVGMMEAKKALEAVGGDIDQAIDHLRKSGAAKAAKKADRETSEGRVHSYTHSTGKIGVMVEVLCETDFVARNDAFIALCNDIALHIAATSPLFLSREEVSQEALDKEKEVIREQLAGEGKPAEMIEKILEGKIGKYYAENCLLEQPFVKDEDKTVGQLVEEKVLSLGENLKIRAFKRMQIG